MWLCWDRQFGVLSSTLGTCMRVRAPCATKTMAPLIEQVAQLPVGGLRGYLTRVASVGFLASVAVPAAKQGVPPSVLLLGGNGGTVRKNLWYSGICSSSALVHGTSRGHLH